MILFGMRSDSNLGCALGLCPRIEVWISCPYVGKSAYSELPVLALLLWFARIDNA